MRFTIDKEYNLKNLPIEVTLNEATQISKLATDDNFDIESINKPDRTFIISVLGILSNATPKILNKLTDDQLVVLWEYVLPLIKIIFFYNLEEHQPKAIEFIIFKGKKYYLPKSLKLDEEEILCFDEDAKNVVEVSNLISLMEQQKHNGVETLKYICAIYLKPKNETEYNEANIAKRAKLFEELPLSIGLDIFFFNYCFFTNSALSFLISSNQRPKRVTRLILGFTQLLKRVLLVISKMLKRLRYGLYVKY